MPLSWRKVSSAVVNAFREAALLFPHRLRGGPQDGELTWVKLRISRVLFMLHNPRYAGAFVSAHTFHVLGEQPVLGRDFIAEDDRPGAPPVVVLGNSVWKSRYGGDQAIVGRTIVINGLPATIVGVMGAGFRFPLVHDIWEPLAQMPGVTTASVAFIEKPEKAFDAIPGIQPVHEVWSVIALFFRGLIAPRLLLAEVGFVNKRADFSLAQKIPALIYGDLVQPGGESRTLIEFLQGEIRFHENLL